jgi:site-specific recombinase XerD
VAKVLAPLEGVPQLIVKLLYGSGLCIMEAVRLRIKALDFQMNAVTQCAKITHWGGRGGL